MKLHILSDLHLEFSDFQPPATDADMVVLAGDIGQGTKGIYWAREVFGDKPVVYVPGNHEFYGEQRRDILLSMRGAAQKCDVHLLDEDEIVMESKDGESVRILGCTLWTDFCLFGRSMQPKAMAEGQAGLADFRLIREGFRNFSPAHSIELHERALKWLKETLDTPFAGRTVVVTHHLPSAQSVVERFKRDLLSACFASELDYLFGKMALWIHGHTHDNRDYVANGTHVICNPRGYVTRGGAENPAFMPGLVVEV